MRAIRKAVPILIVQAWILAGHASAQNAQVDADAYGELKILYDYEDRDKNLGHLSLGPITRATDSYFDSKSSWRNSTGFNWLIESAPMLQKQVDGGAGTHTNAETNLIAQWSLIDKNDAGKGNLVFWYQFSSTWNGPTTTEFMSDLGILSPPNGGDTHPGSSRDLTQHFAWEQQFADDRIRIQIGKLTTRVLFNLNRYAISDREDYFTPMIVNNPVAHYTARVGFGGFIEYSKDDWYVSGMIRDADADLSNRFIDFESLKTGNWEYVAELGITPANVAGLGPGIYRLTVSRSDATTSQESTSSVSLSFDQDLATRLGAFFRYASSNDTFRTFDRRAALGIQIKKPLGFANDGVGLGVWWGSPTDSTLRSEVGIEVFWKLQIAKFMELSAGAQFVLDPALRTDTDEISLAQLRLRFVF